MGEFRPIFLDPCYFSLMIDVDPPRRSFVFCIPRWLDDVSRDESKRGWSGLLFRPQRSVCGRLSWRSLVDAQWDLTAWLDSSLLCSHTEVV